MQNTRTEPNDSKSSTRSQGDACGKCCDVEAHVIQNDALISDETFCCESQSHGLLGNTI